MSRFDSLFTRFAVPVLQRFTGEAGSVWLTPRGGEAAGPFDTIAGPVESDLSDEDSGRVLRHKRTFKFARHDGLPFWSGEKLVGLKLTFDGVEWAYDQKRSNVSESMASIVGIRDAASEVSWPGFRRK